MARTTFLESTAAMNQMHPENTRRLIARELSRHYDELSGNQHEVAPAFSFGRAITAMATQAGLRAGREEEICASAAMIAGRRHDPHKVLLPFSAFATRDLQASVYGAGGALVSTMKSAHVRDVLRPFSVTAGAGATILHGLIGNLTMAQVVAGAAAVGSWVGAENTAAPHTQPALGEVVMTPKHATAFVRFSRQLMLQADQTEPFIRAQLLEAVGALLDQAVISGSGAAGQPTGIINTAGIGTQAGATLSYAGVRSMRRQLMQAGGIEGRLAWIGAPDVQDVLGGRERAAGGGRFLWDDNGVMGRPAYASSYVAAGTLVCGDWSRAVIGLWGPGFVVEINPFENFQALKLSARILLEVDTMFTPTNAFSVATAVT